MRRLITIAVVSALAAACGGGGDTTGDTVGDATALLTTGQSLYERSCEVCHGSEGRGGGGLPLDTVTADFPDCADLVRWITLGSSAWEAQVGGTIGASGTPVGGGMPAFEGTLTDDDIREVSAYIRSAFSGEGAAGVRSACGL